MSHQDSCVFCQIVQGKSPASKVYADDTVTAFIPLNPFTTGHTLVIPNEHAQSILELDEKTLQHMAKVGHRVAGAIKESKYKSDGINLWLSDGEDAGQDVMHVHLHVFPRYKGDGFEVTFHSDHEHSDRTYLDKIATEIKSHLKN
jgi:diadenosine tetraphosphate (Ap4A) HIT family hydrolase